MPPINATTAVQQRGRQDADKAQPDRTNCRVAAWTAASRHLARDTTGLRLYQRADRTAPGSTVSAGTMGPVAAWPVRLLPRVPCWGSRRRQPAATRTPTAPLKAEQLYAIAAALLVDRGESFVLNSGRTQIRGSIQGPQRDAPHPWRATLRERTRNRDPDGGLCPPGPQQGEALVTHAAGYQAILHGHARGYR